MLATVWRCLKGLLKVCRWLKGLLSIKATSQIGSRNQSTSGVKVSDSPSSVVLAGQGNTVIQVSSVTPSETDSPFPDLEKQMPELFAEMRKDLAEHPFAREFVILKKGWGYNADPNKTTLVYYFEDHPDLRNKLRILQNHRLIQEITYNNTERFTMTEELVNHLMLQK